MNDRFQSRFLYKMHCRKAEILYVDYSASELQLRSGVEVETQLPKQPESELNQLRPDRSRSRCSDSDSGVEILFYKGDLVLQYFSIRDSQY